MLHYDDLALDYALCRRVNPGVVRDLVETGHVGAQTRVLEVGCGTANYLASLIGWTGCWGCGLDPTLSMLRLAHRQRLPLRLWAGRAEELASTSGVFDLVFSVDVIHHIRQRRQYFVEAHRVLTPSGRICTVTDSEVIIRNREPMSVYFPETVPLDVARYPRISTLREMMYEVGFHTITQTAVTFVDALYDSDMYRKKAFSALHLIPDAAFQEGIARLEADLALGPVRRVSRYVLLWGAR
ncbi:MAG: methyltransferase domain-containing protein [Anaerolineae bacterium]|nr:methyltransferase domain-containing protein [Anaerolineae bacterium]